MIIDICMVKATRSQKPAPNHCALWSGVLPVARVAPNTIATARSARAKASGNQRSNQSDRRRPMEASLIAAGIYQEANGCERCEGCNRCKWCGGAGYTRADEATRIRCRALS